MTNTYKILQNPNQISANVLQILDKLRVNIADNIGMSFTFVDFIDA